MDPCRYFLDRTLYRSTIFAPSFWHHIAPKNKGLLFNLRFLVPGLGTSFGPQNWNQKPYSFLFQTPVTCQPNFEQSVHLTKRSGNQIGPRFGHPGPSQTLPRGAHFWDQFGFWPNLFSQGLVYNLLPAGWLFLAGGSHFVGIFGPRFWHHFWCQFLAPGCPQI